MIKVVNIITRLNTGGAALHAILLSEGLNKIGVRDILVCGRVGKSEGDMTVFAQSRGVRPVVVAELRREISLIDDMKAFFAIYKLLKKERPDVVSTHTSKAGAIGRAAALCAGVSVRIHTFHGHIFNDYFGSVGSKIFLFIERTLAAITCRMIAVSQSVKNEIVNDFRIVREDRCVVIPLAVDFKPLLNCESRKGSFRREIGVDDGAFLIAIVGRLAPIKNHLMFLDAAKLAKDAAKRQIKFIIVGDGEMRGELEARSKELGLGGDVIFTGWAEDMARIYADIDIAALTSLNEGLGICLLEAMACAKPVVTTAVGGVKDIVIDGENGFLSISRDPATFSDKLKILIADKELREKMGSKGREFVMKNYDMLETARKTAALYGECVNNSRRVTR